VRLLQAEVCNFGSYSKLSFDFTNTNLALVYGATGSGKSTIPDIPCWILFGVTAKDGAVDDVRSWLTPEEPTIGEIEVETASASIKVTRIRGRSGQNDLYWTDTAGGVHRGKDITETQRLLEKELGVTADLFLTSAYFHEFSPTGQFFTAKAKDRRAVFERIASLDFPMRLFERATERRKETKKELEAVEIQAAKNQGKLEQLKGSIESTRRSKEGWEHTQAVLLAATKTNAKNFEADKAKSVLQVQIKCDGFEADKRNSIDGVVEKMVTMGQSIVDYRAPDAGAARKQLSFLSTVEKKAKQKQETLYDIKGRLGAVNKETERFKQAGGICPHCLGAADNANKDKHIAELRASSADLMQAQAALLKEIEDIDAQLQQRPAFEQDLKAAEASLTQHTRLEDEYERCRETLMELNTSTNPYKEQLQRERVRSNPYIEQLEVETQKSNPFTAPLNAQEEDSLKTATLHAALQQQYDTLKHRVISLTQLYDLSFDLRGELLKKAVEEIEASTNRYLETYFDSEIRVTFSLAGADNLDINIQKSGYSCVYKQLSKGQRGLLKLCFVVSIMEAAANKSGVHFAQLFFDESLDGLDTDLKIKAYKLFEELESNHESIFMIDHCTEFKSLFSRRYAVTLQGDESTVIADE